MWLSYLNNIIIFFCNNVKIKYLLYFDIFGGFVLLKLEILFRYGYIFY